MAGTKSFNFAPSASALLLGFVGKGCYVTNLSSVAHGGQAGETPCTVSHSTPSQPLWSTWPSLTLEWPVVELKVVLLCMYAICQMCLSLNTDVKVLVSFIITSYSYPNVFAFVKSPSGVKDATSWGGTVIAFCQGGSLVRQHCNTWMYPSRCDMLQ